MSDRITTNGNLRDHQAREIITRELQKNVFVLAGAGAGKTYALIERMVAAIRIGAAHVDRMAAITFTRKAAGEMRGRFFLRLRTEAAGTLTEEERARIQKAMAAVDQCFIGTIHSFCGRLLRERPLEAGLAPDFTELDDREENRYRRTVWDQFIQARHLEDDSRLVELEEHGITSEDLYSFFGRRCANADMPLKETATPRPDLLSYVPRVKEFMAEISPFVPERSEKLDKLMLALRRARHFIDNHGVRTDHDAAALIAFFENSSGVTFKCWTDKDAAKSLSTEKLPAFQSSVVEPALRLWRESGYRLVTEFVDEAVAYFDEIRRQDSKVTFQDLLLRTDSLLQNSPDVRAYFQRRFKTILVDEFQDTDPIQAQILFYLTGADVTEKNWRKLTPRPGSLFLVGDDKQSIYRFRRADVETFHFVADRISETGGHVLNLNTSFRSLGNLCRWISESFPSIFSLQSGPYQASFHPLFESRTSGIDAHCVRKISIPKIYRNKRSEIAAYDAEQIVGFISAALRGATPLNQNGEGAALAEIATAGDFLILTRTTGQLSVYARALESAGIPFDIAGGGRLGDSEEIRSIVTMLECVHEPDNAVRFVAYLRGPLAGLSDGDLYDFRRAGGRFSMNAPMPKSLRADLRARVQQAVDQLGAALGDLTLMAPGAAIERTLDRLGLLELSAVHPDGGGSSRAGNLIRLLAIIRRHTARGWHWGQIVTDLRELVDASDYKLEEMTLEMGREDVVRIMNVHQAKGLQAPVVFLADPYDTSYKKKAGSHFSRADGNPYLSMTITKPKGDYQVEIVAQPAAWADDLLEEERFTAAEEVRLLYVAATRARNLLVVSEYNAKADTGPWSPLYRFLREVPPLPQYSPTPALVNENDESPIRRLRVAAGERLERSKRPSYSVRTVSDRDGNRDEIEHLVRTGRGREYGVIVHQIFEEAVRGCLPPDPNDYIHGLICEAGLDESLAIDAIGALQRFQSSALWYEVCAAAKVFTEVPVGVSSRVEKTADVVRGVIDLVYLGDAGWRIVDYKTDLAKSRADISRLRRKYSPQIEDYARYWTQVTGKSADWDLWFVHGPAPAEQFTLF